LTFFFEKLVRPVARVAQSSYVIVLMQISDSTSHKPGSSVSSNSVFGRKVFKALTGTLMNDQCINEKLSHTSLIEITHYKFAQE